MTQYDLLCIQAPPQKDIRAITENEVAFRMVKHKQNMKFLGQVKNGGGYRAFSSRDHNPYTRNKVAILVYNLYSTSLAVYTIAIKTPHR